MKRKKKEEEFSSVQNNQSEYILPYMMEVLSERERVYFMTDLCC